MFYAVNKSRHDILVTPFYGDCCTLLECDRLLIRLIASYADEKHPKNENPINIPKLPPTALRKLLKLSNKSTVATSISVV